MQSRPEEVISYLHEAQARGTVASIYLDIWSRMAFVPALFKALAFDPEALLQAWLQARAILEDPRAPEAAAIVQTMARGPVAYHPSEAVREAVRPFARELPGMTLLVFSLGLSLDGRLERRPLPPAELPNPARVPESAIAEQAEHPLFADIRAVYGTAHVPSMYRALAARDLLVEPWSAVRPYLASARGRAHAGRVATAAEEQARRFDHASFFGLEAARGILAQFRRALPRNMIFAAATTRG